MADIKEFYDEKRRALNRLVKELVGGKHPGQPELETYVDPEDEETKQRPLAVYITSMRKREAGTTAGSVCLATVEMAAYRIADGTHRVSTEEEIDKYLRAQVEQKLMHDKMDVKRELKKMQFVKPGDLEELPEHLRGLTSSQQPPKPAAGAKR